jgi:hypothetical protein
MKQLLYTAIVLLLISCAFDGPSRPDIIITDRVRLFSGPGEAGKYVLAGVNPNNDQYRFMQLATDSLVKIVVNGQTVYVQTIDRQKQPEYFIIRPENNENIKEETISGQLFKQAVAVCANCKTIPIPRDTPR